MRGVGQTTMMRVYASDRDRMARWIRAKNEDKFQPVRIYTADAVRAVIEENLKMKRRIRYLEIDNASLAGKNNDLRRTVNSLRVRT